ncbi:MAG: serpin family protein, partial [Oscillospiraceae bacterium]|nr:serpin family protein [Oscillospiraceae bacterium]
KQSILKEAKPVVSNASVELSKDMQSQEVAGKEADESFINGQTKFALELFQNVVNADEENKNIMISPYSVVQALGMTANGANGETKSQIEQTIGSMPIEDLNQYLYTQRNSQPNEEKCKLLTANSIWIRDDIQRIQVKEDFLQTNADYYNASVFKAPFDTSTAIDINHWVNKNTDTMIPKVLNEDEKINDDILMYLINAVAFDAEWLSTYWEDDIWEETFTTADGSEQIVEMMHSEEYCYLEDETATGFFKYYKGGRYAFLALLPNEDISVTDYVNDLTPEYFQNLFAYKDNYAEIADVAIPKFKYDYQVSLKETLCAMGMPVAFSDFADFSGITETTSRKLGDVSHITFIDVSEKGTRAAAVTIIPDAPTAVAPPQKSVMLDRPFVYSIVDTENNLPIFLGVL